MQCAVDTEMQRPRSSVGLEPRVVPALSAPRFRTSLCLCKRSTHSHSAAGHRGPKTKSSLIFFHTRATNTVISSRRALGCSHAAKLAALLSIHSLPTPTPPTSCPSPGCKFSYVPFAILVDRSSVFSSSIAESGMEIWKGFGGGGEVCCFGQGGEFWRSHDG